MTNTALDLVRHGHPTVLQQALIDSAKPILADLERIAESIVKLHDQLSEAQLAPATLAKQIRNAETQVADREAEVTAEVSFETVDDTARLKFGNDTLRKAETKRRLASDSRYTALVARRDGLERAKLDADMRAGQIQNLIASTMAVQRIKVAAAELYAGMLKAVTPIILALPTAPAAPAPRAEEVVQESLL